MMIVIVTMVIVMRKGGGGGEGGLPSQRTHTTCFPSRHIPKQCVFGPAVTPLYHTSIFDESFTC